MALRFDDTARTLTLSVQDLLEAGRPTGHLHLEVVQRSTTRAAMGRRVHLAWQAEQQAIDADYRPEVSVKHQVVIRDWTVTLGGRIDGLTTEGEHVVVEEIKSTALDASRLLVTSLKDWARYGQQLEIYLWVLAEAQHPNPVGRLVLVSLADGSRHVIGVPLDTNRVREWVNTRLTEMVDAREQRLHWLSMRRRAEIPDPFPSWRPGQQSIVDGIRSALEAGKQLLVEAPTGMGKTAAALSGVLRHAFAKDKLLFWATSRTTQQRVVEETLERFRGRGLDVRSVTLSAKEKVCLNDVVSCRPDTCSYAEGYYDKVRDKELIPELHAAGRVDRETLMKAGLEHQVCPFQLALDLTSGVDVVIGDYNYVFDPAVRVRRLFAEDASECIVVADEVHGLVDRARGYGSPSVLAQSAADAARVLAAVDEVDYAPFVLLARQVESQVFEDRRTVVGRGRNGEAVCEPSLGLWRDLADRVDEIGLDYAWLKAERAAFEPGEADRWLDTARAVLRFASGLEAAGSETVALVRASPHADSVGLLCLDPSVLLGPFFARLGGFVGLSATLRPAHFFQNMLGLRGAVHLCVASPFPPENRAIIVAGRVSTAYRDRATHAPATASLIERCFEAVPGNVAVYFPSFAMLEDIRQRWTTERTVFAQSPGMSEDDRRQLLARLEEQGPPMVLAAVLGGIFAEGIDLPPGALRGVVVAGPGLPPVGLERDLLRTTFQERYDEGFLYASLIPGLTRVVQAAGRLIRRESDRGVIVLVGRRFRFRDVVALLPEDWDLQSADDPADKVAEFWEHP